MKLKAWLALRACACAWLRCCSATRACARASRACQSATPVPASNATETTASDAANVRLRRNHNRMRSLVASLAALIGRSSSQALRSLASASAEA